MFQKFFEDTVMSRFIKNLLATTPIPLFTSVNDGDILLAGGKYIYKDYIIKCVTTGRLFINETDILVPSDTLYPSVILYPGTGEPPAQFKVLALYDSNDRKYNYTYHSKFSYYDSDTHRHLGEYLRYLKAVKGIDMLPYYNCYNYAVVDNVWLNKPSRENPSTYTIGTNDKYKVLAIPIKFFRTYTIAIDCETEVLCRCVIYGESGMVTSSGSTDDYLSDGLATTFTIYPKLDFDSPILFSASPSDESLLSQQKNLYLLIQVPKENNSSIVVLEGNYISNDSYYLVQTYGGDIDWDEEGEIIVRDEGIGKQTYVGAFDPGLSLLQFNCQTTFAFSDRLIEYLLLNVISPEDEIPQNVERVQRALVSLDDKSYLQTGSYKYGYSEYMTTRPKAYGLWDDKLTEVLKLFVEESRKKYSLRDMDGYVNKDIEQIFMWEGAKY